MVSQKIKKELRKYFRQFCNILEKTDFSIATFLCFGAALQLLSLTYLPPRVSIAIPLVWLLYRFLASALGSRDVNRTFADVQRGIRTMVVPEESDGIVILLLGARMNHPFGKLAPGMFEVDAAFQKMWGEAEKNRHEYGYLGRTATLADTSDDQGTTTIWISYWRSVEGLHKFAAGAAHRVGWNGWLKGEYPYLGLMHELYHAPKGKFETIYGDFPRWGFGNAMFPQEKDGQVELVDCMQVNQKGSNMFSRMKMSEKGQ